MNSREYEILQTAIEYIERLNGGIIEVAACYRKGELIKGHEYIGVITEGMEWLIHVISQTKNVLVSPIEISSINKLISEYVNAMQNEDSILMADLLEYEIFEELQRWYDIFRESVKLIDNKIRNEN